MAMQFEDVKEFNEGDRIRYEHPAFAQIAITRRSGTQYLYGSDFEHQHSISLTINMSKQYRRYAEDQHTQSHTGQLIEIVMSEAQFASLMSSMGLGNGVPCTLTRYNGQSIPQIPHIAEVAPKFRADTRKYAQNALDALDVLAEKLEEAKLSSKQRDELLGHVESARMNVKSNLNFVLRQFGEYIENTLSKAKTEITSYAQAALTRLGLATALKNSNSPITYLEDKR
ncbi:hypothetical protein H1O16_gp122 [Burkholderia phage BcepSaruman]|uniref:Uncharacterized protein n=1 Tax=Burkholderia phage BcepSaruman TaxID=2530032 RepID=A0A4D5ZBZ9_9CAUD|nr:hypothetical protein H1O16_gp122 [Burkholderia phage BcepSaruman]QBX06535.1 hypothetical protein BcepSaruman_122 [Burkholderia phage BcepSaruman]